VTSVRHSLYRRTIVHPTRFWQPKLELTISHLKVISNSRYKVITNPIELFAYRTEFVPLILAALTNPMFEAHPSIQRRTYEPTMASSPSFCLGGSANHSLRDLRLAEPSQEVDRPIASQGIEIDRRSFCVLPATPNPHNVA